MNLPNCSDSVPFEEMFREIKDDKVCINSLTLMCLISDLHYLMSKVEALEDGIDFWKNKANEGLKK